MFGNCNTVQRKSHPPGRSVETVPLFEEVKHARYLAEVTAAAVQETELQSWEVMGNRDVNGNGQWEEREIKIKDHSAW